MARYYPDAVVLSTVHTRSLQLQKRAAVASFTARVLRTQLNALRAQLLEQLQQNCSSRLLLRNRRSTAPFSR
jgi:hypothetical protein